MGSNFQSPRGKDHSKNLGADGIIILKLILIKLSLGCWWDSSGVWYDGVGPFEKRNYAFHSIKKGFFLSAERLFITLE